MHLIGMNMVEATSGRRTSLCRRLCSYDASQSVAFPCHQNMTELTLLSVQAETTEVFHMHNNSSEHGDLDRAVLLRNCNGKLTQWMGVWETEMQRANGERFHMEFLKFFRLYVRLFLNSFGIQGSLANVCSVTECGLCLGG